MNKPPINKTSLTSSHWGAGVATVLNGSLQSVTAHRNDPDPSSINDNYVDGLTSSARLRRPAVRESYLYHGPQAAHTTMHGRRGNEAFVEVSWDTAEELVCEALTHTIEQHGNKAIYAGSYGWASAGRFHHAQSQLKRFLNCLGGFVRSEGNYSYQAALVLMPHIVGNYRQHVTEATRMASIRQHGELVVMFGGIPMRSGQVGGGGVARHVLKSQMQSCREAGVEFVSISPLKADALDSLDAQWLAPRPGSDTAIMMGLAHTLLTEGLCDLQFLQRYTVGFDALADCLLGKDDGIVKDVDWAARQSGLDAGQLRQLARRMASSRTLLCTTASLQRAESGEQPLWMTVALASMLGQIGLPGAGFGIGYGADAAIGTSTRPMSWPTLPQGTNPIKDFIPVAMVADMLLNPGAPYEFNGQHRHFPDIRLVWWAGGNPFHHHQDLNRLRHAFQQPETIIVNELNWTATARHADIVLPATATLERNDFGGGTQDMALIPMPKILDPVGDARNEYTTYRKLAKRLGIDEAFSLGRSEMDWLNVMWDELRDNLQDDQQAATLLNQPLPAFDEFMAGDILQFEDPTPDQVFLSAFRADPDKHALPTPSGRIELFSQTIAGFNYDDCPGHASWLPPCEWLGSDRADTFPLHLISGQPETRLHSQWDTGSYSQDRKVQGREPVLIHPDNAAARGIADGDVVRIFNDRGACLAGCVVTDTIRTDVVFLWTGAWYDPDTQPGNEPASLPMDKHGNPNVLTHDRRTSRLSQGPAAHSTLVEVERWDKPLPPITAYTPPL